VAHRRRAPRPLDGGDHRPRHLGHQPVLRADGGGRRALRDLDSLLVDVLGVRLRHRDEDDDGDPDEERPSAVRAGRRRDERPRVFVRSGKGGGCGRQVVVLRLPVADVSAAPTRIVAMPDGVDIDDSMSLASRVGSGIDLLFSRIVCDTANIDVYELPDIGSVPDAT
jgi:hypothetical protein